MDNNNIIPLKSYSNANKDKLIIYKENKNKSGIYRWNNLTNGKSYIGSSKDLYIRFRTYYSIFRITRILKKSSSMIYSAILKYGHSNFSVDILEYCDKNVLIKREQYYINLLKPQYNILKIAGTSLGYKHTEEAKRAISVTLKGRKLSEETKNAISIRQLGRKHTEETIQKLREIKKKYKY